MAGKQQDQGEAPVVNPNWHGDKEPTWDELHEEAVALMESHESRKMTAMSVKQVMAEVYRRIMEAGGVKPGSGWFDYIKLVVDIWVQYGPAVVAMIQKIIDGWKPQPTPAP